jgi:ribonuclease HI
MNLKQDTLYIFTDGSCFPNPGPGGWGAVLVWNGAVKFLYGGSEDETNNSMELCAILGALKARTDKNVPTILYTDSQYCVKIMTQWWKGWEAKGWVTGAGKPVKNQEYIREILQYTDNVQFKWVKGHDGHALNEAADVLSRKGRANHGGGDNDDPDPDLKLVKGYTYPYVSTWGEWYSRPMTMTGNVPFDDAMEVEIVEASVPKPSRVPSGSSSQTLRDTLAGVEFARRIVNAAVADERTQDEAIEYAYGAADLFIAAAKRNGKL